MRSERQQRGGGWTVDDLIFTGITNAPFKALVPDPGPCAPLAVDDLVPTKLEFALCDPTFRFALPEPAHVRISVFALSTHQRETLRPNVVPRG